MLVGVIALALAFNFTNGFHDAADAIATAVGTRALTPRAALLIGAVMNLVGSFLGEGVARTIGSGIIRAPDGLDGLKVALASLLGAIVWNLVTWWFGLPSSSSHALIGGMVGAALAAGSHVFWSGVVVKVVIPMVLSPLAGGLLGAGVMIAILWIFRRSNVRRMNHGFRRAQRYSAAAVAMGHGLQDAQKTMGIIVLALVTTGHQDDFDIPVWVVFTSAAALSLGTYSGGWRIMRTLGRGIVPLNPPMGFAAEVTTAGVLYVTSFLWHAPVSTTHTITAAIAGVGAIERPAALRWIAAWHIVMAWVLTLPMSAAAGALAYELIRLLP
ncbi:inorganic phosphate transporter [Bailinhaonella thermotolerans]|uniref:inorganic phosphate transporter n=1 Tax=Bailinhaonella thermotolerans TaxID=1070861 RepID=UPI0026B5BE73